MRGEQRGSEGLFAYIRLEERIAADHPLRAILALVPPSLAEFLPRVGFGAQRPCHVKLSDSFEPSTDGGTLNTTCGLPQEMAMLAEIYFLRLESLARASEEHARAQNPRFVPF